MVRLKADHKVSTEEGRPSELVSEQIGGIVSELVKRTNSNGEEHDFGHFVPSEADVCSKSATHAADLQLSIVRL
jgi:hypothetical protein